MFLSLCGLFFHSDLNFFTQFGFGMDILNNFFQLWFVDMATKGMTFTVPLLTMRLFAEERKLGTMELLFTYPLSDREIFAGKFLAAATVFLVMLAATLPYPIYLYSIQPFDFHVLWAGYAGLVFLGMVFIAIGLFVSSLTDSQVVAGVGSLFLVGSSVGDVLERSLGQRRSHAGREGLFDLRSLLEFLEGADRFHGRTVLPVRRDLLRVPDVALARIAPLAGTILRSLKKFTGLALNVVGLLCLLAMIVTLSFQHNFRVDLTPARTYTLSPHSLSIIDRIKQPVKVTAFVRKEDPNNEFLSDLFWRMRLRQPKITTQIYDLNRNPAVARAYRADAYGSVIVECGPRRKSVSNIQEEVLMAAILQVTRDYDKTIYVLTGHGEHDVTDYDRNRGFTTFRTVLEQEQYHVKTLSLFGTDPIPRTLRRSSFPGRARIFARRKRKSSISICAPAARSW